MPSTPMVRLADFDIPLRRLREHPERYDLWWRRARAEQRHGLCLCSEPELRLVIRQRQGRHHLAVWPGEGPEHHEECPFHSPARPPHSGRGGYDRQAITESLHETRIRLGVALATRSAPKKGAELPTGASSGGSRRSVGLLGMLHHLWESTGLTTWAPGRARRWEHCHHRVSRAASSTVANQLPLDEVLHVVAPFDRARVDQIEADFTQWRSRLLLRRGLFLGEIKQITPTRYGVKLNFRHLRHPLFARQQLLDRVKASHRHAFAEHPGARQVVLAVVERTSRDNLVINDMAVMLTNDVYLPADSRYEIDMADHLIAERRSYYKPVRYDHHEAVFPDFVVTDTEPHTCVEVLGMLDDPVYARRWQEKQAHYEAAGTPLVWWDVDRPLPALPKPGGAAGGR